MPRFVRCIEGHVFDAEAAAQCPICGAVFEARPPASADVVPPPAPAPTGSGAPQRTLIVSLVVAALGVGLGAGALVYALHGSAPATATSENAPASPNEKAKEKSGADTAPPSTPAAPAAPKTAAAEVAPAPAVPPPPSPTPSAKPALPNAPAQSPPDTVSEPKVAALSQPSQSPAATPPSSPSLNVSNTLQTALDVARMLVTFNQRNYQDALAQAEALAGQNNPVGLYMLGGLLEGGLGGRQDLARARASFTAAVNLGEPTAALFLGRMLEGGLGGPPDPEKAKQLYLFAARSMVSNADQELARLHLDGARGMTALEAYQTLIGGTPGTSPNAAAMDVINQLYNAHSTTAVCLHGWIVREATAKGWRPVLNGGQVTSGTHLSSLSADTANAGALNDFEVGAVRSDPWCEWGMATLAAEGVSGYPKNQVEADVFYRLAAMNRRLGSVADQVKQQMADLESKMSAVEKAQADGLLHSAVPSSVAP